MKKIFVILSIFLSLCAISAQAQSVDSTHTSATTDTTENTPKNSPFAMDTNGDNPLESQNFVTDSLKNFDNSPDEDASQSVVADSVPSATVRLREGHRGKGIKISSDKPVEHVSASDSVLRKKHSPTIAGCLSIIPGGGQIYNKKYWKLPIVYVALGISGYFVYNFAHQMVQYKKEFINRRDGNTALLKPEYKIYTDVNILALKNTYRRRMEIAIAVTAILYFLNILDAVVDAHLFYFDISDDLSMRLAPQVNQNYMNSLVYQQNKTSFNYGVNLTLNFR